MVVKLNIMRYYMFEIYLMLSFRICNPKGLNISICNAKTEQH